MNAIFWSSGSDLLRIVIIAPLTYAALILILRVSGKRMLSKMNAFDLVVTIALGSILATILLSKDVVLAEGLAALGLLIALQYIVAWSAARSSIARKIIKSEPTLLYFDGVFIRRALWQENVSEEGVRSAMRAQGFASTGDVAAVVIEADGTLSVLSRSQSGGVSTWHEVRNAPAAPTQGQG